MTILISALASFNVCADEVTRVNFGKVTPNINADINSALSELRANLPLRCDGNCDQDSIRWDSVGNLISHAINSKKFLYSSGVPGVGIEIDLTEFNLKTSPVIIVRLIKLAVHYGTGEFNGTQPLLRWSLGNEDDETVINRQSGEINIIGSIYAGTCSPEQGDLYFNLKPVSIELLKEINTGQKIQTAAQTNYIYINCTPGVADSFSIRFTGKYYNDSPNILDAGNGVGFIAEYKTTNKDILWNGLGDFAGVIPESGRINVPIKVYYTRTGEDLRAGNIYAKGQFAISYR